MHYVVNTGFPQEYGNPFRMAFPIVQVLQSTVPLLGSLRASKALLLPVWLAAKPNGKNPNKTAVNWSFFKTDVREFKDDLTGQSSRLGSSSTRRPHVLLVYHTFIQQSQQNLRLSPADPLFFPLKLPHLLLTVLNHCKTYHYYANS